MTKEQALNKLNQYEKTSLALNHAGGVLYYDGVTAASKGSYEIRAVTAGAFADAVRAYHGCRVHRSA